MLLFAALVCAGFLLAGVRYGFAAIRWIAAAFILAAAIASGPALWTILDATDRCLDSGGRWNEAANICER